MGILVPKYIIENHHAAHYMDTQKDACLVSWYPSVGARKVLSSVGRRVGCKDALNVHRKHTNGEGLNNPFQAVMRYVTHGKL